MAAIRHAKRTQQRANKSLWLGLGALAGAIVLCIMGLTLIVKSTRVTAPVLTASTPDPLSVLTPAETPVEPAVISEPLPEPVPAAPAKTEEAVVPTPEVEVQPAVAVAKPKPPATQPKPKPVSATKPSKSHVNASAFVEEIAPELRRYAMYRRMATVPETRAEAYKAVLKAINDARVLDPDMKIYDLDGTSSLAERPTLAAADRATIRAGKVFLALELTRAECPKLMERYARE